MAEEHEQESTEQENTEDKSREKTDSDENSVEQLKKALDEANDKYIRLYADFENFKKISAKNKEELLKYANEDLMSETLTVVDHLDLALQHSEDNEASKALAEGVTLTLKELLTVLEKHGLKTIDALGKPFDPAVHHAMSQIETDDAEENTVVKEFRKGYTLKERVLRAPLVGVAKKKEQTKEQKANSSEDNSVTTEENKNN